MGQAMQSLEMTETMKGSRLFRLLQDAKTICFIGDSLTEGTMNGGVPWYEPLRPWIHGRIFNFSQGGATTKILLTYFMPSIVRTAADLFVIAAGANDILFRDPLFCAVTAPDYVRKLQALRDAVTERRPDARFAFIAPWLATDGDASIIGGIIPSDADTAYRAYTAALKAWCGTTGDAFINANGYIAQQFALSSPEAYLIDFIHPNAGTGVRLYAEAVLQSGDRQTDAPPPSGMRIDQCREADVPAVGAFYDQVVRWLDDHINYPKWIYRVYPSEPFARQMAAAGTQYICRKDRHIIGVFSLNDDPQGAYQKGHWKRDLPDGSYMVLHALAIAPEMHGQGLGSAVIRFCVEKAKAEGYKALRLDIVPNNHPARRLYEKNGFRYAGDADLERGIAGIPIFSLFELNL